MHIPITYRADETSNKIAINYLPSALVSLQANWLLGVLLCEGISSGYGREKLNNDKDDENDDVDIENELRRS